VDIKAGFRNTKTDQMTISTLDQSRSEPDFSQDVQVNVSGMIGDKLNILADWNTHRQFEYENQLKIKYTGYDDEIVQSVEAGNVSLSTPSSFIGSSQALFGIKAQFQLGPLTLTTLASQKKGQIKEMTVSGGANELEFEIKPYEFSTNHFFVDPSYKQYYEAYYASDIPTITVGMQNDQIVETEVWVSKLTSANDGTERQGTAIRGLGDRPGSGYGPDVTQRKDSVGVVEPGRFVKLDPSMYEMDGEGYLGVISLNANVSDQQVIGIGYRTASGRQVGDLTRNATDTAAVLTLKMIKPKNLLSIGPTDSTSWGMLLKNIYPLPGIGRNLKAEGFTLDIYRTVPGAENQNSVLGQRLLRVFGLDKHNADKTPAPEGDGVFDFIPNRTVSQLRAEIIFPTLRPFDEGIYQYFKTANLAKPDSAFAYSEIYDQTKTFASQSAKNMYTIKGKAKGETSSRYSLGSVGNVVEGSVQVLLDGRALVPNVDYTVDYIIGEVVIKNDRALVPGANLQIKFEQNDLFQLASKTLLGARGELSLSPVTKLGFTIMNLNQQTLSDKVRLGEEPNTNTMLGMDGSTLIDLPFLTRALDALPMLSTHEPSSLKISGEAAYMMPNPNTKVSTITSDNSQGVAYIDDFEGARRSVPVGISYVAWTPASPPEDPVANRTLGSEDTTKMFSKAKLSWYNLPSQFTRLTDVYPNKKPGNVDQTTVMILAYHPLQRGAYNYSHDLTSTLSLTRNWGGIMKPLSLSGVNLLQENVNFIEIWMRVDQAPPGGKMIIDLGSISEDVIPNRKLNSEDLVLSPNANGTLQEGEDIGLDMLNDAQERALYPDLGSDPSGDDYAFDNSTVGTPREDFTHINGTEGNKNGPGGNIPDTEDLNSNGVVDLANSYYEYELLLDTVAIRNPRVVGGGDKTHQASNPNSGYYYQFRIPIREYDRMVGNPSFENVEDIRVFFRNEDSTVVRIADFALVGSQWQKPLLLQSDSSYAVSVVGIEENPQYSSPPGVQRERDPSKPNEDVQANEQSLVLSVNQLADGDSRQVVKYYNYKPLDLFNYRVMKMFMHGDSRFMYTDTANYDAEMYFRFGLDSSNFYEYRAPIHPALGTGSASWDPQNDVVIHFADLTAIKQARDTINVISLPIAVPGGPPGAVYRVLGSPSLTRIVYMALGITNPRGKGTSLPLRGEVWFDELRLTSVDDTPGWAYRFDTQLKLADFAAVSFNYSRVDPAFHSLEARFGSRQLTTNWAMSTSAQLEKLLPDSWTGSSLPVSYSHTESDVKPQYLPNSDIDVQAAAQQQRQKVLRAGGTEALATAQADSLVQVSQTHRVTDTYAAPSLRIAIPSPAWYIRDTFNKLTLGFNYTTSSERSPSVVRSISWGWTARIQYAVSLPTDYYIMPFKSLLNGVGFLDDYKNFKLFFIPATGFNWGFSASRSRSTSLQRADGAQEVISRQFSASRQMGFAWKLTEGGLLNLSGDYNVSVESSLLHLELDDYKAQRSFSQILGDIFGGSRLINFGEDTRYSQRSSVTSKPSIPNIFSIKKYLDFSASYNVDYSWQNLLTGGDLGKSAGFSNSINMQTSLKLKQLFDPLFDDKTAQGAPPAEPQVTGGRSRRGTGETQAMPDSLAQALVAADSSKAHAGPSRSLADQLKYVFKLLIKIPILDYDNVSINFNQSNQAQNSGVIGTNGFVNFWGRIPFVQDPDPRYGPSRLYQLGLISDPSGRLTNFGSRSHFPFFGWDVEPGARAPGGTLVNSYRQTNRLTFKTGRDLWAGAHIDLNWNVGWSYSRQQNVATDSIYGMPTVINQTMAGSVDRSFLTFPNFLFFSMFKTNLTEVGKRYSELKNNGDASQTDDQKLTQAFEEGFEAMPFLRKAFGPYLPRVNWTIRWDGLEKFPLFARFVQRLSLDHAYSSNYTRQFQIRPGSEGERTDGQRVTYGYSPLMGLNFTFKELWKGNLGANFRYNTNTAYELSVASRNIVENLTQEISFTGTFSRRGFEIPLFGLSLNNDIDISFSYSVSKSSRKTYDISKLDVNVTGMPLEGNTRTVMEPRIKYVLSQRVTA
jgi:cell surface protein SprA